MLCSKRNIAEICESFSTETHNVSINNNFILRTSFDFTSCVYYIGTIVGKISQAGKNILTNLGRRDRTDKGKLRRDRKHFQHLWSRVFSAFIRGSRVYCEVHKTGLRCCSLIPPGKGSGDFRRASIIRTQPFFPQRPLKPPYPFLVGSPVPFDTFKGKVSV